MLTSAFRNPVKIAFKKVFARAFSKKNSLSQTKWSVDLIKNEEIYHFQRFDLGDEPYIFPYFIKSFVRFK